MEELERYMKIVHYLIGIPPVRGGGMIKYATDLMIEQLRRGNDVILLIPGRVSFEKNAKCKIKKDKLYHGATVYRIDNALPVSMFNGIKDISLYTRSCDEAMVVSFFEEHKPDIFHIHTLMGLNKEWLGVAKSLKIPTVYTTHDYFGICPKGTLFKEEHVCEDSKWNTCEFCCVNAYSKKRLRIEQSKLYYFYRKNEWITGFVHKTPTIKIFKNMQAPQIADGKDAKIIECMHSQEYNNLRQYYEDMFKNITYFHFNSSIVRCIYESRLGSLHGEKISISNLSIRDNRKRKRFEKTLNLAYFGNLSQYKGYFELYKACEMLKADGFMDFKLHLYVGEGTVESEFVECHDPFKSDEMQKIYDNTDLVIVPSQWKETFGFIVLEALSFGTPVIVSENVGAKDIIPDTMKDECIYGITTKDLYKKLKELYCDRKKLQKLNENILSMEYAWDFHEHEKQIEDIYKKLI